MSDNWPTRFSSDNEEIDRAVELLRRGGLVAFPTETVYGLGADARNRDAVEKIFLVKQRPRSSPLIVHVAEVSMLTDWVDPLPPAARRLADRFWPGPLTMILPKLHSVLDLLTGGTSTLGVRIPSHPIAQSLLKKFGSGIAAPSANRFQRVSATLARHIRHDLGDRVDLVIDGGPCQVGIESTIVDFSQTPPVVLRLGSITHTELEQVANTTFSLHNRHGTSSPGLHPVHYSPQARTQIVAKEDLSNQAQQASEAGLRVVVLSQCEPPDGMLAYTWWKLPNRLEQVAQELYQRLHEVDEQEFDLLLLDLPVGDGIAAAIRDRLLRAAGQGGLTH